MNQIENRFYREPVPEGKTRFTVEIPIVAEELIKELIPLWGQTIHEVAATLIVDHLKQIVPVVLGRRLPLGTFQVGRNCNHDED